MGVGVIDTKLVIARDRSTPAFASQSAFNAPSDRQMDLMDVGTHVLTPDVPASLSPQMLACTTGLGLFWGGVGSF